MKIRYGFVSNSSSSSFTCNVCGETQSGMDMCLSDAYMFGCTNGHYVCNEHKLKDNEELCREKYGDDFDVENSEMPPELCPICQFQEFQNDDLLQFAVNMGLINLASLITDIRARFKTYKEFAEFLK